MYKNKYERSINKNALQEINNNILSTLVNLRILASRTEWIICIQHDVSCYGTYRHDVCNVYADHVHKSRELQVHDVLLEVCTMHTTTVV